MKKPISPDLAAWIGWCIATSKQKQKLDIGTARRLDNRYAGEDTHNYVRVFGCISVDEVTIRPGTPRVYMGIQWRFWTHVAFFQFRIDYSLKLLIYCAPEN